jgi:BirA family biotin operon repressor/biotin-[acetyl-CoA-carboxylase] ligase
VGTDGAALDRLLAAYRERCLSIGAELRVSRPAGEDLVGTGVGVGPRGELLVDAEGTVVPVVVGDVVHAGAR